MTAPYTTNATEFVSPSIKNKPGFDTEDPLIQWAHNEIQKEVQLAFRTRKRSRSPSNVQTESSAPPEKVTKTNDSVSIEEKSQAAASTTIDFSRLSQKDILLAYKRIWINLDLSKSSDAVLEPFVWQKIRQLQKDNQQQQSQ